MYKETKPAVKCEKCHKIVEPAQGDRFCDGCQYPIKKHYIQVSFHFKKRELLSFEVCSAECIIKLLDAKRNLNYQNIIIHMGRQEAISLLEIIEG